jgi:hypothetical protein
VNFCSGQILGSVNGFLKIKYERVFSALEDRSRRMITAERHDKRRDFMKQLTLAAAVLALLSVAANAQVGKGKAPPPPPVVTKG